MSPSSAVVILPVKPPAVGKSRLVATPVARRDLAAAFALDTAAAALHATRVAAVLVLTDDHWFADELADLGCVVLPDPVDGDLNGTLRQGAAEVRRRWPDARPTALCADLPALLPTDLDAALAVVLRRPGPSFVADADGTGTTLYAAPSDEFDPRFGAGSADAHALSGADAVPGPLPTLRQDVDDAAALSAAARLGLGPRTRALLL
ncbi:MAG TPA: 2-phospho-L-lactate guanylyltransferase [Nocardioides sp.]